MNSNGFTQFAHQKYLNLDTERQTSVPAATPVWCAEAHGTFYLYTLEHASKVTRIRNNPKVRIVPCDGHGNTTGDWGNATARILDVHGAARGHQLLNQQYGWLKSLGDVFSRLRPGARVVMAIDVV
jgi:uncharacterized protein